MIGEVGPIMLGDRYVELDGAQAWAVSLFASYLFGHLVFVFGSWLDELYDWSRRYAMNPRIAPLRYPHCQESCPFGLTDPPGGPTDDHATAL